LLLLLIHSFLLSVFLISGLPDFIFRFRHRRLFSLLSFAFISSRASSLFVFQGRANCLQRAAVRQKFSAARRRKIWVQRSGTWLPLL
jgi:hypothetical protein